jgi:hypothetical protein
VQKQIAILTVKHDVHNFTLPASAQNCLKRATFDLFLCRSIHVTKNKRQKRKQQNHPYDIHSTEPVNNENYQEHWVMKRQNHQHTIYARQ